MKKIISFLLVLSMCFILIVPAFAEPDIPYSSEPVSFGDYVLVGLNSASSFGGILPNIPFVGRVFSNENVCGNSSRTDFCHHADAGSQIAYSGTDEHGRYVVLTCVDCGNPFRCYSSDLYDAYNDYVEELPVNGYGSDGFYWTPTVNDYAYMSSGYGNWYVYWSTSSYPTYSPDSFPSEKNSSGSSYRQSYYFSGSSIFGQCSGSSSNGSFYLGIGGAYFNFPVLGKYTLTSLPFYSATSASGSNFSDSGSCQFNSTSWPVGSYFNVTTFTSKLRVSAYTCFSRIDNSYLKGGSISIILPTFHVVPSSSIDTTTNYTPSTRVTNYTLNLGTIVNGNVTNVYQNTTIINETNKTLTVPSTGTTYNINNWVYNYTDRSVSGTLDTGDNYDVTFGDDNLIIHIGDDEYTYHYLVEHEVCDHTYVVTDSTAPSCTEFGSETLTCSKCGDSYTENIAPLGHDYQLVQSVPASGEDAGYDLYRCTRCGDEYQDSTFVNDNSEDASYWAWLKNWLVSFKSWLGDKLDALLDKDSTVNFDPNIQIDIPVINPGIKYADDDGNEQVWHPSDLKQKFIFWKDIRDIGVDLYTSVQVDSSDEDFHAPELIVHLAAANSPYGFQYGGDVVALDLSWYAEYKPTVDSIAGGFLWLLYLYGVWRHLPDIFSGVGMLDNRVADLEAGERHSRKKVGQ